MQPSQQEVSSAICGFTASLRLSISSLEAHRGSAQQGWRSCPDVQSRCAARATCPSILCGMAGACFSAFPCSPPTSVPLGKAGLGASMGGTGGREVRRDGGKGATALGAGRLRGTAAPQCHPLQLFPIALCCAGGGRARAGIPSHLWAKCSGGGTLHPALISLLGSGSLGQLGFKSAGAWNFC